MPNLTEQQQVLFDKVTTAEKPSQFVLRGYAGTGKTYTLSTIVQESEFEKILIAAPTVAALSVLQSKIPATNKKITFSTISKLTQNPSERIMFMEDYYTLDEPGMTELRQYLTGLRIYQEGIIIEKKIPVRPTRENPNPEPTIKYIIDEELLRKQVGTKFKKITPELLGKVEPHFTYKPDDEIADNIVDYDLIIVDEMSMVSEDDVKALNGGWTLLVDYPFKNNGQFYKKGKHAPHVIFAGDKGQLPPVNGELNHYFAEDELDVEMVELNKILRSTDVIASTASLIRSGKTMPFIVEVAEHGETTSLELDQFIAKNESLLKECDIAIAYTNADVKLLNERIRAVKGFSGKRFQLGETLMVEENSVPDFKRNVPFANGEELKITRIYNKDEAKDELMDDPLYRNIGKDGETEMIAIHAFIDTDKVVLVDVVNKMGETKQAFLTTDSTEFYGTAQKVRNETFKSMAKLADGKRPLLRATFGYARTIHKSQGGEWKNVLMWITSKNEWVMRKNNPKQPQSLPYTAYTRAAEKCHLVYKR